ncbi:HAMP domain-containing protein [Bacillus sp. BGMRC 2118]|nr:HAMP domain-containing protein [Bacillus sp. BGMRC 2118]
MMELFTTAYLSLSSDKNLELINNLTYGGPVVMIKIRRKKSSLANKVLIFISFMILFVLANVITSFLLASKMSSQVEEIQSIDQKYMLASEAAYKSFMTIDDNTLFLTATPENTDPEILQLTFDAIYQSQEDLKKSLEDLKSVAVHLTNSDNTDINNTIEAANNYLTFNEKVMKASEVDRKKGYHYMYETDEEANVFFPLSDALNKLTANAEKKMNLHAESTISFGNIQKITVAILGFLTVVIAIGITLFIRNAIKPLSMVAAKLKTVGEGNFTEEDIHVSSSDEIGEIAEATNSMKNNLRQVIGKVGAHAEHVASSSEQLSASAEQTSSATNHIASVITEVTVGTEEQAHNTKTGLNLLQEVATKLGQVTENAEESVQYTEKATIKTDEGQSSISQVMEQMSSMNITTQNLTNIVKDLGAHSTEIGEIVNVIQSISSQTNLLALNAAIEAARAGESGKGFAVVAEEVRKLAEQSSKSTEQVLQLVTAIQTKTIEAMQAAETTNKEVSSGIQTVKTANSAFGEIQVTVNEVKGRINEVATSVKDMSEQSKLLVESIEAIAEVAATTSESTQNVSAATEEQLASMEEISVSATSLSQLAEELLRDVSRFRI